MPYWAALKVYRKFEKGKFSTIPKSFLFAKRRAGQQNKCCVASDVDAALSTSPELVFTVEYPLKEVLQYLDFELLRSMGLYWKFRKKARKPFLSPRRSHP